MPVVFGNVVRQFVPTYQAAPPIIVIAQQWPCWLSTVISLRLPLAGGYFALRFHTFFQLPSSSLNLMLSWSIVEHFCGIDHACADCTILASGSMNFLATVERGCAGHTGALVFVVDHFFPQSNMRDTLHLY